jgi:hypothetical protein
VFVHTPWRLLHLAAEVAVMRPDFTRMPTTNTHYWEARRLETKLEWLGYQVFYEKDLNAMGRPAFGLTDRSEHIVRIDKDLSWDGRYLVLAHEAGHVVAPGWLQGPDGEVFAESVAVLIDEDGIRESARYLSDSKSNFFFTSLAEWRAIYHAAALLTD